ncbi:hypothetical protein BDV97DRAFT_400322 [Delphinella strobiligena]|nr:hypothetical protein BDV97DRAFT_400322 [Delphinella strobiligena]
MSDQSGHSTARGHGKHSQRHVEERKECSEDESEQETQQKGDREDLVPNPRPEEVNPGPRMTSTSTSVSVTQAEAAAADDVSRALERTIGEAFEYHRQRKNQLRHTAHDLADDVSYITEAIKRIEDMDLTGSPWEQEFVIWKESFAQDKAFIAAAEDFLKQHLKPYLLADAGSMDGSSDEAEQGEEE